MSVPCSVLITLGSCRPFGAEDLPCEVRGGRMRNGIVRMDDIETLLPRNLDDLVGERQRVLRLTKDRVIGTLDAIKHEPRLVPAEPRWPFCAQQVAM